MKFIQTVVILFFTLTLLSASSLQPEIHPIFIPEELSYDNADEVINTIAINTEQTRLLISYFESSDIVDAETFDVIKSVRYKSGVEDSGFVKDGFVVLTNSQGLYYYNKDAKLLYHYHDVKITKMYANGNDNTLIVAFTSAIWELNLRSEKFTMLPKKVHYDFVNFIRDDIAKVEDWTTNRSFFINIYSGEKVEHKEITTFDIISSKNSSKIKSTKELLSKSKFKIPERYRNEISGTLCIDTNNSRFAITTAFSHSLTIYTTTNQEAVLTLPLTQKLVNIRKCILYGDTLVLNNRFLHTINIKKEKQFYQDLNSSIKLKPSIATCKNRSYAISLWTGAMYSWDISKGKMLWYSESKALNRNHWDIASYRMQVGDTKYALIQPYGQRRYEAEIRVNLSNGNFTPYNSQKEPRLDEHFNTCDGGLNGDGVEGLSYSFTHKGLEFYSLSEGEWIVIAKDGYFNVSSKKALNLVYIGNAKLGLKEIEQYYRPDIIEAKLTSKDTATLIAKKVAFTLRSTTNLENRFFDNAMEQFKQSRDYRLIKTLINSAKSRDELKTIQTYMNKDKKSIKVFYRNVPRLLRSEARIEMGISFYERVFETLQKNTPERRVMLQSIKQLKVKKKLGSYYLRLEKLKEKALCELDTLKEGKL